jgi:hypothetical protein
VCSPIRCSCSCECKGSRCDPGICGQQKCCMSLAAVRGTAWERRNTHAHHTRTHIIRTER